MVIYKESMPCLPERSALLSKAAFAVLSQDLTCKHNECHVRSQVVRALACSSDFERKQMMSAPKVMRPALLPESSSSHDGLSQHTCDQPCSYWWLLKMTMSWGQARSFQWESRGAKAAMATCSLFLSMPVMNPASAIAAWTAHAKTSAS